MPECPICLEKYKRTPSYMVPRSFECGHSFCSKCIEQILKSSNKTCSLCKYSVKILNVQNAPINYEVLNLIEKNCSECTESDFNMIQNGECAHCGKWLCLKCKKIHTDNFRKEVKNELEEIQANLVILENDLKFIIYYETGIIGQADRMKKDYKDYLDENTFKEIEELKKVRETELNKFLLLKDEINKCDLSPQIDQIDSIENYTKLNEYRKLVTKKKDYVKKNQEKLSSLDKNYKETPHPLQNLQQKLDRLLDNYLFNNKENSVDSLDHLKLNENLKNLIKSKNQITILVAGRVKSGKSKFTNSFRGLNEWDEGAAKIDNYESTTFSQTYTVEINDFNINLIDTPGYGTEAMPIEKYIDLIRIEKCDAYIYLYNGAFTKEDNSVVSSIKELSKNNLYIARTCADRDYTQIFANIAHKNYQHSDESNRLKFKMAVLTEIQKKNTKEIENNKILKILKSKIYHISCDLDWIKRFDMDILQRDLIETLPKEKKSALIVHARVTGHEILEKKKELLYKYIDENAIDVAKSGLSPAENINLFNQKVYDTLIFFQKTFNLNKTTFEKINYFEEIRNIIEFENSNCENCENYIFSQAEFYKPKELKDIKSTLLTVPILIGFFIALPIYYYQAKSILNEKLNEYYEEAKRLHERNIEIIETSL